MTRRLSAGMTIAESGVVGAGAEERVVPERNRPAPMRPGQVRAQEIELGLPLAGRQGRVEGYARVEDDEVDAAVVERVVVGPEALAVQRQEVRRGRVPHVAVARRQADGDVVVDEIREAPELRHLVVVAWLLHQVARDDHEGRAEPVDGVGRLLAIAGLEGEPLRPPRTWAG